MHEIGIARRIIREIEEQLRNLDGSIHTLCIRVALGADSHVSRESLLLGFDVAKRDSGIPFAELDVFEDATREGIEIIGIEYE
jgi:Zn finger protein HypA/HybF involved in hydrogenase expression